jgi:hypothetical protein
MTDAEKIHDEVHEQVSKCTCVKQFRIHKIGEGKYRVCSMCDKILPYKLYIADPLRSYFKEETNLSVCIRSEG